MSIIEAQDFEIRHRPDLTFPFITPQCARVIDGEDYDAHQRILDPDEIIIPNDRIYLRFSYPLGHELGCDVENFGGFTRFELLQEIYRLYRSVYMADEEFGDHQIHGHTLEELFVEGIVYNPKTHEVFVDVGS